MNNMENDLDEHSEKARDLTKKINAKIDTLLYPMVLEMKLMSWKPEFQQIMWEAVSAKALHLAREAIK